MLLNDGIAISTDHILLVPYEERHVPIYHKWMQDKDIQEATASEPLTLEEEFAMQRSWRTDGDKLTFIICKPLPKQSQTSTAKKIVEAGVDDAEDMMLGDVNLFISPAEDDPEALVGEVELMIADTAKQGKGYGRLAFLAFLKYVTVQEEQILREYRSWNKALATDEDQSSGSGPLKQDPTMIGGVGERIVGQTSFQYLRARIRKDNLRSMAVFEDAGFQHHTTEPNYFGELEMRMHGHFLGEDDKQFTREWWGGSWRVNGWTLLKYQQSTRS